MRSNSTVLISPNCRTAEDIDGYILADDAYNGYISLYKLQSGEYQINVGPDGEGKVYVIDFKSAAPPKTFTKVRSSPDSNLHRVVIGAHAVRPYPLRFL